MRPPRAVAVVRNGFVHDARVLRAVRTLAELGYRPVVVAAVTDPEQARSESRDGFTIERVSASAPLAWVTRHFAAPPGGAVSGPARRAPAAQLALRVFRLARTVDYYWRATRLVLRARPTLIHCNDHNTMWIGVAAKVFAGGRLVYDAHELWPDRNGRWEWRPWLLATEALFTRIADAVVVASPGFVEPMQRRYRIARPRVVLNVPDGRPAADTGSPDGRVAVYVGALLLGRGLEQAIDAIALVPGVRLRLIGHGPAATVEALRRQAADRGVADRVEHRAPVEPDRVVLALAGACVGLSLFQPVCLSHQLTLPNKIFEYVAAGVPVLSSDMAVSADFVRRHGIGDVVPARDPVAIARGLARLLEPGRLEQLRPRLERAAQEFSWDRERVALIAAYEEAGAGALRSSGQQVVLGQADRR